MNSIVQRCRSANGLEFTFHTCSTQQKIVCVRCVFIYRKYSFWFCQGMAHGYNVQEARYNAYYTAVMGWVCNVTSLSFLLWWYWWKTSLNLVFSLVYFVLVSWCKWTFFFTFICLCSSSFTSAIIETSSPSPLRQSASLFTHELNQTLRRPFVPGSW